MRLKVKVVGDRRGGAGGDRGGRGGREGSLVKFKTLCLMKGREVGGDLALNGKSDFVASDLVWPPNMALCKVWLHHKSHR